MYFFYYYPIGVDVPRPRWPWLTIALGALCTGVFVLSFPLAFTNDIAWMHWAYRPAFHDPLKALTAMFLHGGWMHLAGNLLYLAIFGPALERSLGRFGFLLVFLGTGYLGNLTHGALVLNYAPTQAWAGVVGASGAISGMLGIFLLRFPRARLRLAYWAFLPLQGINRTGVAELPAVIGLLLWVLMQVIFAVVQGVGAGTAYGAHLGGLGVGMLLALALGMPRKARTEGLLITARRHLREGRAHAAVGNLQRYLERAPWDHEAELDLARAQQIAGDRAHATQTYRRAVAREIDADRFQSATDIYLEARRSDPFFHLDADAQVKTAHWLERSGHYAHAVNAHLDFARFNIDDPRSVHSLARAATLLATRLQRSAESVDVLEQALTRFPDHPLREWLESELQSLRRGPRVLSARAG